MGKPEYFKSLTGIRAIAAYMVFIFHLDPIRSTAFFDIRHEFHIGVTLFFVLSGFLIAYRYSDLVNFNMRQYMVNRVARIFPVYFVLTTLTFVAYSLVSSDPAVTKMTLYLANITFLRGFFDEWKFTGITAGWSLTTEETFYLLAPLCFFFLKRSKSFLYILPMALLAIGSILVLLFSNVDFYGFFGSFNFMLSYTFFGRCVEFFIGIGLALAYKNGTFKSSFNYFTYLGLAGIAASLFSISAARNIQAPDLEFMITRLLLSVVLPFIGILPLFYGLITENSAISKLLASKPFILLGKSSYVFYLIHNGNVQSLLSKISENPLFQFIALNIISIAIFKWFEEPANTFIRKRFGSKRAAPIKPVQT